MRILTALAIVAAVMATGVSAEAATKKDPAMAQREASCKAQAAKKYSTIHFLKRRDFVNQCMGSTDTAKAVKPKPTTTGKAQ
jgi:hypothetical protein